MNELHEMFVLHCSPFLPVPTEKQDFSNTEGRTISKSDLSTISLHRIFDIIWKWQNDITGSTKHLGTLLIRNRH